MKKLEAIIKPYKLDEVRNGLRAVGVEGMTVTEVRGFGRQKGHKEIYRGTEYTPSLLPKVRVEIVCQDDQLTRICGIIKDEAKTGKMGDGKIFISQVEQAIRIRTGEVGDKAL